MSHNKGFICDAEGRKNNRKLLGEFEVVAERILKRIGAEASKAV